MRGTVRKISMPRRLVADLMHASLRIPFVSLHRPLDILREAFALLVPGGKLVVACPNIESWAARAFGSRFPR